MLFKRSLSCSQRSVRLLLGSVALLDYLNDLGPAITGSRVCMEILISAALAPETALHWAQAVWAH
jgi:hypothetical protein